MTFKVMRLVGVILSSASPWRAQDGSYDRACFEGIGDQFLDAFRGVEHVLLGMQQNDGNGRSTATSCRRRRQATRSAK
jgi:hypothetical protein